jgi:hypothetical protein
MKSTLGLLVLLLFTAGVIWIGVAARKYSARKRAEAQREEAFLAELTSAAAKRGKPAAAPAPAPRTSPAPAQRSAPAAVPRPAPATATHAPSRAIRSALAQGDHGEAARLFVVHAEERTRLVLQTSDWEPLGRALLVKEAYLEAAWALHAGAVVAGDAIAAQTRLVEIATRASAAGHAQIALKLYDTLLRKYPGSQYTEIARAGFQLEEKKLGKG